MTQNKVMLFKVRCKQTGQGVSVVTCFYIVLSAILICISMTLAALRPVSWSDPLDLAELHNFRLVYFKHKEIFLVVCIVSR